MVRLTSLVLLFSVACGTPTREIPAIPTPVPTPPPMACEDDGNSPNHTAGDAISLPGATEPQILSYDQDDYYVLDVPPGQQVVANIRFSHSDNGDLDLDLVDVDGDIVATSDSTTSNESATYLNETDAPVQLRARVTAFEPSITTCVDYTIDVDLVTCAEDDAFGPNQEEDDAVSGLENSSEWIAVHTRPDWLRLGSVPAGEQIEVTLAWTGDTDLDLLLYDANTDDGALVTSFEEQPEIVTWVNDGDDPIDILGLVEVYAPGFGCDVVAPYSLTTTIGPVTP